MRTTPSRIVIGGDYPTAAYPDRGSPIELGFDGANFFVVSDSRGARLLGARITQGPGTLLDTTPLELDVADPTCTAFAPCVFSPQLASNRAGRHLIAYRKGGNGTVYGRLFSTCP